MKNRFGQISILSVVFMLTGAFCPVFSDLDEDADGLSDVWERQFQAGELSPNDDTDNDGHSNMQESVAGTNPHDNASKLQVSEVQWLNDGRLKVQWPTQKGKIYYLLFGETMDTSTWQDEGTTFYGNNNSITAWFAANTPPTALGGITREVWHDVPGTKVAQLIQSSVLDSAPDGQHLLSSLEYADSGANTFGSRIRGWIVPKEDRQVIFYIAANTQAEFRFSTTDQPDDATRICRVLDPTQPRQWHKSLFQQSLPYGVQAGQRYYIEILHKQDSGNDHVAVAWRDFDGTEIDIIPGDQLAPWLDTSASQSPAWLANDASLRYAAIAVSDEDDDGDAVSTWEENQIGGLNPYVKTSQSGFSDLLTVQNMFFASSDEINVAASAPSAIEKEQTPGAFRITRTGSPDAITLNFTLSGNSDGTKGSASAADYELRDALDMPITNSIVLPFGANFVDVFVHAVSDELDEVPETLTLTVTADAAYTVGSSNEAAVVIRDAENTLANQRLFIGYMSSENGAITSGSGIASVLLQGDNDNAIVNVTFSGLTTEQASAHIHVANPSSGPIVQGLSLGQISDFEWPIRQAQFMLTDQAVLDALFSGQLYVNVHSAKYPSGEIRGNLNLAAGSSELQIPDNPPLIRILTGDDLDRDIMRFLQQSTFGATTGLYTEVKAMIDNPAIGNGNQIVGYTAWLDLQMNPTLTPSMDLFEYTQAVMFNMTNSRVHEARRYGNWLNAVHGADQLRQRMAFALSQIFVTSDADTTLRDRHLGMAAYYQMLNDNAFGTYETILMNVTKSPVMGHYLSHLRNQKAVLDGNGNVIVSPDENYAREIMQLLSVGLVDLHLDGSIRLGTDGLPVPTYNNDTITEFAKIFTGLGFGSYYNGTTTVENNNFFRGNDGNQPGQVRWVEPLKMFDNYHETGEKAIIQNVIVPPGLSGETDLQIACAVLGGHKNTPPFIAERLIQRFVTSNPSRGYVYRAAQRFKQTGGDLGETLKTILLDSEARYLPNTDNVSYGKPKEPVIKMIQLQRVLNPTSGMPLADLVAYGYPAAELAKFPAGVTRLRYRDHDDLGQIIHNSPSVFNFFLTDFTRPGKLGLAGLKTPELQIKTESQVYDYINEIYDVTVNRRVTGDGVPDNESNGSADNINFDTSDFQDVYDAAFAGSGGNVTVASTALIDAIDAILNAGGLKATYAAAPTPNPRSVMIDAVVGVTDSFKVRNALYIAVNSPQFSTQK